MANTTFKQRAYHVIEADYTAEGFEDRLNEAHAQGYDLVGVLPNTSTYDAESETSSGSPGALIMYRPEAIAYEWQELLPNMEDLKKASAAGWEVVGSFDQKQPRFVLRRRIPATTPVDPLEKISAVLRALPDEDMTKLMVQFLTNRFANSD